jgi:thioredoxin 1
MDLNVMPDNPEEPLSLDDEGFQKAKEKYGFVVFDFWASWCPPCRMMTPILVNLAKKHSGTIAFGKINTDDHAMAAQEFGISAIPTFLVFKNGELVDRITGAMPEADFEARLQKLL